MPKIPKIEKFRGDNEQSFTTWIKQFEAQCIVLEVAQENDKKKWREIYVSDPSKKMVRMFFGPDLSPKEEKIQRLTAVLL